MRHTKGEWQIDKEVMCIVSKEKERTTLVCDIQVKGLYESEPLANAQIISAAPDLYDICNGILCCPKKKVGKHTTSFILTDAHIKMLKAAIAKAEPSEALGEK